MVLLIFAWNVAYYRLGIYIDLAPDAPVTTFMTADEDTIYMLRDGAYEPFEIRGATPIRRPWSPCWPLPGMNPPTGGNTPRWPPPPWPATRVSRSSRS